MKFQKNGKVKLEAHEFNTYVAPHYQVEETWWDRMRKQGYFK